MASEPSLLSRIARAYFQRERARLGIPQEEQAAREAETVDLMRRAQAARLAQQMEFAPAEHESEVGLRKAQTGAATAQEKATLALAGQREEGKPGTPHYERDEAGNVVAVIPQPDGTFKQVPLGQLGKPQREPAEPGRLSPLVDAHGRVIGTFHNVTGAVQPVKGTEAAPGEPATIGGTELRRSPLAAQERKDKAGLELALEGAQNLRTLIRLPNVKNAIGFFSGRLTDIQRRTIGADPEVQELFRTSDRLAEFLLRALSGAQINESEYARLRTLIPDPRSHISKFQSDLDLFEQELQSTIGKRFPGGQPGPAAPSGTGGTFRIIGVKP
jgi:hypothetical protein